MEDMYMKRSRAQQDFESELIFHEREWRIQRVGWALLVVFLAFALGGLFGNGPLSRAHADGAAGRVEYERFVRYGLTTDLVITPTGSAHGVNRIEIDADYLEAFRVEHITPEPAAVRLSGPRIVYEFASAAPGASISFHIRPQRLWRHTSAVSIDGSAPFEISQLTYP
jgi:hypothetical protein